MKIKLDEKSRKYIEVEVELNDKKHTFKYYEKNTKQIKALKKLSRKEEMIASEFEDLVEMQFYENLQGDKDAIKNIVDFYEENGNIYDFVNQCDEELGKLKKKD